MRVQADRVGALDSGEEPGALPAERGETTVGGVDMQPDVLRLAEIRHLLERVDRSGARRPGVGADRHGLEPRGAILGDRARQSLHVQTVLPVGRDHADALPPDADDHRGTRLRTVALVAHVDGRALRIAGRFPGSDEGVHAGGGAAAGQQTPGTLRVTEPAPEPVQDDELDLARTARDQPGAGVHVPGGGQEIRDDPRPGRLRRNEPETAGMVQAGRHREDVVYGPPQDLLGRAAIFWRLLE